MSSMSPTQKVCDIIERYFAEFAQDNSTDIVPVLEYAKDFLAWDEDREKQEKILERVAPKIEDIVKTLFPFRKQIH